MKSLSLLLLAVCLFFCFSMVNAQILAWDFNGNLGNETTVNSTTTNTNLNVSTISRGAGLNPSSLANSFSSTSFTNPSASLETAIANNDYLQFTVSPKSGFKVSLSTLDANFRRSSQGPNMFQWQYSLDGFATAGVNVGSTITFTDTNPSGVAQTQINLSTIAALQNVAYPNTITFRLYGWGATSTAGTFALGVLSGNDLAVGGTVEAVPTAASAAISGRVVNYKGRGISYVTVILLGGNLSEPKYASTDESGYYNFTGVPVGENYVVSIMSKRYNFQQSSIFVSVTDNLVNIDFVGDKRQ